MLLSTFPYVQEPCQSALSAQRAAASVWDTADFNYRSLATGHCL